MKTIEFWIAAAVLGLMLIPTGCKSTDPPKRSGDTASTTQQVAQAQPDPKLGDTASTTQQVAQAHPTPKVGDTTSTTQQVAQAQPDPKLGDTASTTQQVAQAHPTPKVGDTTSTTQQVAQAQPTPKLGDTTSTTQQVAQAQPDPKLGDTVTNSVGMKLVYIPPGEFIMGSPENEQHRRNNEKQHRVILTKGFWMGATEVTQRQWKTVMGNNPSKFDGPDLPVERVSWNDAVEFGKKLSRKEGKRYRLPTEAEWEYACRAATTTPFNTGKTISTDQANYNGKHTYDSGREGVFRKNTTPVAAFSPNAWALFDTHGNVYEWCADWYAKDCPTDAVTDPTGPGTGTSRVSRGGSWNARPRICRSAFRYGVLPDGLFDFIGFRVCRDME
jgi:formylglycine-generating enzyme required for sulfatase activity